MSENSAKIIQFPENSKNIKGEIILIKLLKLNVMNLELLSKGLSSQE